MLKQFKKGGHQPKIPLNIIFYAGDGHTREIYKFLAINSIYKFDLTEYSSLTTPACLNMKNIKQPLFDRPNVNLYIEKVKIN